MKTQVLALIAILTLGLFSCQDFNVAEENQSVALTEDVVLKSAEVAVNDIKVESVMEEINHEAEMFAESEKWLRQLARFNGKRMSQAWGKRYKDNDEITVTIDTSETRYPITITLDYGEATELNNGRVVSGTIAVNISAAKNTDGATKTITYACTVDTVTIAGTSTHTFTGDSETSKATTSASDLTFTLVDGTVIERLGNHTRTWVDGVATQEREDDIIEVTGSTNISASTGDTWSKTIVETLVRIGDCRHYVQGITQITYNEEVTSELDFGDGTCDNLAILTVDGEAVEIELNEGKAKTGDREDKTKGSRN